MRSAYAVAPALLLALAPAAPAGGLADTLPLCPAIGIETLLLNDRQLKDELKITKAQEKSLMANQDTPERYRRYSDAANKMAGPDKDAKVRALWTKYSEQRFRVLGRVLTPAQVKRLKQITLQRHGMTLFDHPEIRQALKLGDAEVKTLRAAFEQLEKDVAAEIKAKRMSPNEAHEKFSPMAFGVPDKVRQSLTEEQRATLQELLGEPYKFNP